MTRKIKKERHKLVRKILARDQVQKAVDRIREQMHQVEQINAFPLVWVRVVPQEVGMLPKNLFNPLKTFKCVRLFFVDKPEKFEYLIKLFNYSIIQKFKEKMPKADKKQEILGAALKVFARYGFKKATVEDVAKEVSMTKSNLYFYVAGKRELYEQSIRHALRQWRDSVAAAIAEKNNAVEKFKVMAVKSYEYLANDEELRSILIRDPGIFTLSPSEDRFYEINQGAMLLIRDILVQGIHEGHFHEFDVEHTTEFLFSVYIMFLIKTYIKSEGVSAFRMYEQGTALVLRGLCRTDP